MSNFFNVDKSPLANFAKKGLFNLALISAVALPTSGVLLFNQQPANADFRGVSIGQPANGSCYRVDRWQNGYNGSCDIPGNSGNSSLYYTNLRSITSYSTPAVVQFIDPTNYWRVTRTCLLSRNLQFPGNYTCFNPKPYGPTIIRIKPVYNNSLTYFTVTPN